MSNHFPYAPASNKEETEKRIIDYKNRKQIIKKDLNNIKIDFLKVLFK